jgi:ketosteroid isomerase-like protein
MAASVVDRLVAAINTHDLDALVSCFAPDYAVDFPAHPGRGFTGPDHVRRNWEALFAKYPGMRATVTARVESGNEIWGEWEFRGDDGAAPEFWQRGVIVVVAEGDAIGQARFYMEPVGENAS